MPLRRLKLNGMQGNVMQMVGAGGMPPTRPVAGGGMPPMPTFQPAQKLPLPVAGGGLPPAYKPTPKPMAPSFAGARAPMQGRMPNGLLNMPQGVVPQTFARGMNPALASIFNRWKR